MSNQQKNNEEEIELGSLFVIIGQGISKVFNFFKNIFIGIFDFFIQILLFLKKHIVKISIAALIAGVIGVVLEYNKEQSFGSDMLVQPNFNSARQLYNNIDYFNSLVKQKDSVLLAKTFNISKKQASSLKSFTINPIQNENDLITSYDDLILEVDTLTAKSYSFALFKKAFTSFDYKVHKIHVEATDKNVFNGLDNIIISSIIKNEFFNKVKKITNENLNRTDSLLRKNLSQTDSLFYVYKKILLTESKKENSSTTIDLGGKSSSIKELELFKTNRVINDDLKKISTEKSEKYEIINVISNLQPVGYKISGIQKNLAFQFALLGASLMILLLLIQKLNKYLDNYKKS